jgi:hypothetical protein
LSPITAQEAWDATDPGATDEARREAAARIMAGVAANDAYWDSRGELEALKARADGHGVVSPPPQEDTPTGGGTSIAPTVEGTAMEEPPTALDAGGEGTPAAADVPPEATTVPDPGVGPVPSDQDTVARLRAQVTNLGGTPEA